MISVGALTPLSFLRHVRGNVIRIPSLFNTAWPRQVTRIRTFAKDRLRRKPGKVRYPIRWTSERQRRAYFATNGFGGGIPSKRTDRMINAWEVDYTFSGENGELTLTNDEDYAQYVVGGDQQGFHKDTGWYKVDTAMVEINAFAVDGLEQTWITVTDVFAGVPQT